MLLISALLLMHVSSSWGENIRAELQPGEMIKVDGYSIELSDISVVPGNPAVLLNIYDNGIISPAVINEGELFVLKDKRNSDKLGIKLEKVYREGYLSNESRAIIEIRMRPRPEIAISMSSDRDVYHIGDQIRVDMFVENRGDGNAENIHLHLDPNKFQSDTPTGPRKDLSKTMHISLLRPGELWKERVSLRAPSLPETEGIELVATAEYVDAEGNLYRSESDLPLTVLGPLELHKHVQDTQTFGRTYYVIDTVRNTGDVRLNLSFRDCSGDEFQSEGVFEDSFELLTGETRIVSYAVKAKRPGEGLVLPPARCTYSVAGSTYTVTSESPVVDVFGPRIEARRYVWDPSGDPDVFQVCMDVKNSGNRYAGVRAYSIFPEGIEILNGSKDLSFALAAGSSRTICWSVRCPNVSCMLPSIDLIYFDPDNNMFRFEVPPLKLENISPEIPNMRRENVTEHSPVVIREPVQVRNFEAPLSQLTLALLLLISALIWLKSL